VSNKGMEVILGAAGEGSAVMDGAALFLLDIPENVQGDAAGVALRLLAPVSEAGFVRLRAEGRAGNS
jgi:hypothetical protein